MDELLQILQKPLSLVIIIGAVLIFAAYKFISNHIKNKEADEWLQGRLKEEDKDFSLIHSLLRRDERRLSSVAIKKIITKAEEYKESFLDDYGDIPLEKYLGKTFAKITTSEDEEDGRLPSDESTLLSDVWIFTDDGNPLEEALNRILSAMGFKENSNREVYFSINHFY